MISLFLYSGTPWFWVFFFNFQTKTHTHTHTHTHIYIYIPTYVTAPTWGHVVGEDEKQQKSRSTGIQNFGGATPTEVTPLPRGRMEIVEMRSSKNHGVYRSTEMGGVTPKEVASYRRDDAASLSCRSCPCTSRTRQETADLFLIQG